MRRMDAKHGTAALALAGLLMGSARMTFPDETPEAAARALVEAVTATRPETEALDAWSRTVLDRALESAGTPSTEDGTPPTTPLPAERHAATLARSLAPDAAGPAVLIFTSLALPESSWRRWSLDAARAGATLVLRGVVPDGLAATVRRLRARLPEGGASVAIDPALFRRFRIDAIPAVAVVPGGIAPCRRRGCADDAPPPHDRIAGNIGLVAALEAVAAEGAVGRETAQRHLARLREARP
ncbi:MAG: type-F conjugative transfer system pilin assembly protein TrbC [Thiotrichales bacterium]|nr:type-F conjugative transfer system pilin assembly protein TrbC [Thiotrichales bacterium]